MALAIETNRDLNIGLSCVLEEVLDYPTLELAYQAYLKASNAPEGASYKDVNVFVSGLMLPKSITGARQLADHIEFLAGVIELGIGTYRDANEGKIKLIQPSSTSKLVFAA